MRFYELLARVYYLKEVPRVSTLLEILLMITKQDFPTSKL